MVTVTGRVYVYDTPGRYVIVRGPELRQCLRKHRIPAMYSAMVRGYRLTRDQVPDFLAAAQEDGYRVTIKRGDGA